MTAAPLSLVEPEMDISPIRLSPGSFSLLHDARGAQADHRRTATSPQPVENENRVTFLSEVNRRTIPVCVVRESLTA